MQAAKPKPPLPLPDRGPPLIPFFVRRFRRYLARKREKNILRQFQMEDMSCEEYYKSQMVKLWTSVPTSSIDLLLPNGKSIWRYGCEATVRWECTGQGLDTVCIQLYKAGIAVCIIAMGGA